MLQLFDIFNQAERPPVVLCNPNKAEIYSLDMVYNLKYSLKYNTLDEITFTIPETVDGNNTTVEAYDYVLIKRLVYLEGHGYFEISSAPEDMSGVHNVKNVVARSLESKLIRKRVTGFGGTYKFYDVINTDETLFGQVVALLPNWSIGTIDPLLWDVYRTFDVVDTNVYSFLMNEVSTAYECIFEFDTINNTISAYTVDNATTDTDIYISFDNLLKHASIKELDDEITTKMSVYGAGDLDIRSVNPLGTASIYNFDYYKTTDWMEQSLIDAIDAWEALIDANQSLYATTLALIKVKQAELLGYQVELVDLNNEYLALEGVQKARIESNQTFADINAQLASKQLEIDSKETQIENTQTEITTLNADIVAINDLLSFENNFTAQQLLDLDQLTFENTYQNENIIQTDIMTEEDKLNQAQELYDQAVDVLVRLSMPRYTFEAESINFVFLKEFESFKDELDVGSVVYIEFPNEVTTTATVLEIHLNYDKPDDFSLSLSNRLRLDDGAFQFTDLFGQVEKTGASVSFKKDNWENWSSNYKDDVTSFINSALDTSVNNVINAENQEILINQNGLRGRTFDSVTGTYDNEQVWLTSNVLAFTKDAWQTASTALGKVSVDGVEQYGLVADVVVGRLLAGNQLTIENEGGNFTLDSNGAVLTNASFTLQTDNGKNKITLDPTDGIKIEKNVGGTWNDQFYVDSSGNVVFAGDLSGASGTFSGSINASSGNIGGWHIDATGIYDDLGNYIRSNGNIKLGNLTISGSTATFTGTIYANKLSGTIEDPQLGYGLNAGKVGYGSMSGSRIYGGTLRGGAGSQNMDGSTFSLSTGAYRVNASGALTLDGSSNVNIYGGTLITNTSGFTQFLSYRQINGYSGYSGNIFVGDVYSSKRIKFHHGMCYGFDYL